MHFKNNAHWEKYSKIYDKGALRDFVIHSMNFDKLIRK